jgi:hypothetical protein
MSGLETLSKPILTPLIRGESCNLGTDELKILSRWLAVKVIVSEHARRDLVATTREDRRDVMRGDVSDRHWQMWIGKHSSREWHYGGYFRHAVTLGAIDPSTGEPEPPNNSYVKNTQAVTIGLGDLILHAVFTRVDPFGELEFRGRLAKGMRKFQPFRGPITWPPEVVLSHSEVEDVAMSFDKFAATFKWHPLS